MECSSGRRKGSVVFEQVAVTIQRSRPDSAGNTELYHQTDLPVCTLCSETSSGTYATRIETLGATFVRPNLLSQFPSSDEVEMGPDTVEKSFLGCPEQLLNAVQFFSLQRDRASAGQGSDDCIRNISFMMECVRSFDSYSWATNLPESTRHATHNLAALSECYKLGALIYGQRVLDMVLDQDTSQEEVVQNLFATIEALNEDATLFKCILWPIFVAGLECRSSIERGFVMRALERFWTVTLCLNTVNAGRILRSYWQTENGNNNNRPSNWVLGMGQLGEDWLLI